MFRITDIRTIAMQIEENGERTYQLASQAAHHPEIAQLFAWMAAEERGHVQWFQQLSDDEASSLLHQDLEEMGRNLLQEIIAKETFSLTRESLNSAETLVQILEQSLAFEKDTILFYTFIRSLIEEEKTQAQLDEIIAEENKHVVILQQQLEKLAKK